jgi:methionyl-tRNA formyltransferase
MRLIFAGTPDFGVPALDALHAAGHELLAVLTQPDRPAGRGRKLSASPVGLRATELGIPVHKFPKLDAEARSVVAALQPEAMIVVAYGLILPQAALDIPRHGCFNIHASLLPRWRGAAPIARAVEAGDAETGITIMRMDAGLDTGPMLLREAVPIGTTTTAAALHDSLAALGGRLIVEALARLALGELAETPQPATGASYARKLDKDEARIDWSRPAIELARQVRGFNPAPVAWTTLPAIEGGEPERLRLWNARALPLPTGAAPGTVIAADAGGLHIATGEGVLVATELQRPGGRQLMAAEALRGWNPTGVRLG